MCFVLKGMIIFGESLRSLWCTAETQDAGLYMYTMSLCNRCEYVSWKVPLVPQINLLDKCDISSFYAEGLWAILSGLDLAQDKW